MNVGLRATPAIAYLVHDLTDPAVRRRRLMLEAGGARVRAAGFHRRPLLDNDPAVSGLGETADGNFPQRIVAVLRWALRPRRLRRIVQDSQVVIARNLEMLLLARVALVGRPEVGLHYECLDIHRLMLGRGAASRALRGLERLLLGRVSRVIISSPAFERNYFRVHHPGADCLLVENRLACFSGSPGEAVARPPEPPPWIIGWFGMIRCRRSLSILSKVAAASKGRVRVIICGRPSPAVFPDLAQEVAELEGVSFEGPYAAEDLQALYGRVHLVWAVDFFEEGLNSAWLLPNRLYEGGAFDRPVIALSGVETGRWLAARRTGLVLTDPSELQGRLASLTPQSYGALVAAARRVFRRDLICDRDACRELVRQLTEDASS